MNTHFKVGEYHIVIDMGALELMANATGGKWANPLEDIPESRDQAALILYGGLARVDELEGRPQGKTYDECKTLIRSFTPGAASQLFNNYVQVMTIPGENEPAKQNEEKKS
jgi:hypothetical protein